MFDTIIQWFQANSNKLLFLSIVLIAAAVITKILSRALRELLNRSSIPSASIFINLTRVVIWTLAAALVLQPVFGINPTTIVTALGIGGLAISLGLKDTIANFVGGFGLMLGKVIQPGDIITVGGTTGVVKDINWRQTVVSERNGNDMVIPNSVLNTSLLERLTPEGESSVTVGFTIKAGSNLADVERRIVAAVSKQTAAYTNAATRPSVQFTAFSPYGIEGQVLLFAKPGVFPSKIRDEVIRALANADFIEQRAATGA